MSLLADRKTLTLEAAKKIAAAAEVEAKKNNWNVVICILDDGGHLLYLQRLDGTQIGSVDVAQAKARTAVFYKRPSKVIADAVAAGSLQMLGLLHALPLEGGEPILVDGQLVGAIGVSGVTSAEDGQVARAGLASWQS